MPATSEHPSIISLPALELGVTLLARFGRRHVRGR